MASCGGAEVFQPVWCGRSFIARRRCARRCTAKKWRKRRRLEATGRLRRVFHSMTNPSLVAGASAVRRPSHAMRRAPKLAVASWLAKNGRSVGRWLAWP